MNNQVIKTGLEVKTTYHDTKQTWFVSCVESPYEKEQSRDGLIKSINQYNDNGDLHGKQYTWYYDGRMERVEEYYDGKLDGCCIFYEWNQGSKEKEEH